MTQRFSNAVVRSIAARGVFGVAIVLALGLIRSIEREKLGLRASISADRLLAGVERYRILILDGRPVAATLRAAAHTTAAGALAELHEPALRAISDAGPRIHLADVDARLRGMETATRPRARVRFCGPVARR